MYKEENANRKNLSTEIEAELERIAMKADLTLADRGGLDPKGSYETDYPKVSIRALRTMLEDAYRLGRGEQCFCDFCHNAAVDPDLSKDNDASSFAVGVCSPKISLLLTTGMSSGTQLALRQLDEKNQEWRTVGAYKMKYCPECGRKLFENSNTGKNTAIEYLCRGSCGSASWNRVVLPGEYSSEQVYRITERLAKGCFFNPELIGFPKKKILDAYPLCQLFRYELYPGNFELTDDKATVDFGIAELVRRVEENAGKWEVSF